VGSRVCIYLPRHLGAATERIKLSGQRNANATSTGQTVMFVDDEAPLRTLAVEVLEESGYTALEAVDGVSALSILESARPIDLLVTDVSLPGGINGRQLADAARALRPGLKVLFVTGFAAEAVLCQGRLGDGFKVLTKPFSMKTLMAVAGDIIGGPPMIDAWKTMAQATPAG
jgi:CheY-like chemotaxis protein